MLSTAALSTHAARGDVCTLDQDSNRTLINKSRNDGFPPGVNSSLESETSDHEAPAAAAGMASKAVVAVKLANPHLGTGRLPDADRDPLDAFCCLRPMPFGCELQSVTSGVVSSGSTWVPVSSASVLGSPSSTSGFGHWRTCELSYARAS